MTRTTTRRTRRVVTLAALGVLALPVGIAAAQSDDAPVETPTTIVQERARDREQLHDRAADGTCTADGQQARRREQLHVDDVGTAAREQRSQHAMNRAQAGPRDGSGIRSRAASTAS